MNTCCGLLDQIIALLKEKEGKNMTFLALPPGVPQPPMMGMPGFAPPAGPHMMMPGQPVCMPGMPCCPVPPNMMNPGQPVCLPGMPCPGMLMSRPMEPMPVPQPMPRAPVPPPPQWVVGEVLPNPPMIQVRKDDVMVQVTPHGKRIHVSCKCFEAKCDRLTSCDGGERFVLEGNVRLTMQTGNKPGKVVAERVEVYVPDGSVELVPDTATQKRAEPIRYECNSAGGTCP